MTDTKGWTLPKYQRPLYISNIGNDNADGKEQGTAIRTLARAAAMMRTGAFDAVVLRNGDIWNEALPQTGTGHGSVYTWQYNGPRAKIGGISVEFGVNPVTLQNLELVGNTNNDTLSMAYVTNVLIEGCLIRNGSFGITIQGLPGHLCGSVTLRRNVICDNYNPSGDSSGMFMSYTSGPVVYENNAFVHNGWSRPGVQPPGYASVFNHNVYSHASNNPGAAGPTWTGNVFAMASSHGLQARSGGTVQKNLFLFNSIGLSFGLVNGGGELFKGGVTGSVVGNWFVGNKTIADSLGKRGTGIEIANVSVNGLTIADNMLYDDSELWDGSMALSLARCSGTYDADDVGIHNLTVTGNMARAWPLGIVLSPGVVHSGINISKNMLGKMNAPGLTETNPMPPNSPMPNMVSAAGGIQNGEPAGVAGPFWQTYFNKLRALTMANWDMSLFEPQLVQTEGGIPKPPPAPAPH